LARELHRHAAMSVRRSNSGSTVMDLLVALLLLGIGLAVVHSGQIASRSEVASLAMRTKALLRAQEVLELSGPELAAVPASWAGTHRLADGMTATVTVQPDPVHPFMRAVRVVVSWAEGGRERRVELARLVRAKRSVVS
jgi:hypothetical protein